MFRATRIVLLAALISACHRVESLAEAPTASVSPPPPPPKAAPVVATPPTAAPVNPWAPVGCDRPFPSAGTRFVETDEESSAPLEDASTSKTLVVVESVSGAAIARAKIFSDRWAPEDDGSPWFVTLEADGSKVSHTSPPRGSGGPLTIDDSDDLEEITLVGARSLSAAIARDRAKSGRRELERALELRLGGITPEVGGAKVKLGAAKPKGDFDVYPVTAHIKSAGSGMCHTYIHDQTMRGELTLRTSDSAFVDLAIAGADVYQEGVCSGPTGAKKFDAPKRFKASIHIRRDCFAH